MAKYYKKEKPYPKRMEQSLLTTFAAADNLQVNVPQAFTWFIPRAFYKTLEVVEEFPTNLRYRYCILGDFNAEAELRHYCISARLLNCAW
jgi:hypothetical protein